VYLLNKIRIWNWSDGSAYSFILHSYIFVSRFTSPRLISLAYPMTSSKSRVARKDEAFVSFCKCIFGVVHNGKISNLNQVCWNIWPRFGEGDFRVINVKEIVSVFLVVHVTEAKSVKHLWFRYTFTEFCEKVFWFLR
jgi:hypothetical protein